jgi:hypothetical protein
MIMLIAAFVHDHQCRVPREAYEISGELTHHQATAMEAFSACICGPDGAVDYDPRPHRHGGYFMHPSCNRDGWNGKRYVPELSSSHHPRPDNG